MFVSIGLLRRLYTGIPNAKYAAFALLDAAKITAIQRFPSANRLSIYQSAIRTIETANPFGSIPVGRQYGWSINQHLDSGAIKNDFRVMVQYIGPDPLRSLYDAVQAMRRQPSAVPEASRTGKLLAQGRARMARKVGEEAIEVAIEAMRGDRGALVMEAADLLYNLVVLLADLDITPDEILAELRRRELAYGIAEKLPKSDDPVNGAATISAKPLPIKPDPVKSGSIKSRAAKSIPAKRCKR